MDEPEATVQAEHPDAAGWALGVLDPDDAAAFEAHLAACAECQREVAEFGAAARLLKTALPAIEQMPDDEPPPELAARTLAAVERAARKGLRRRRNIPLFSAAAAMAVAAVIAVSLTLSSGTSPALAFSISLRTVSSTASGTASGQAVARQTGDGWSIQLTVHHLAPLPAGSFYECWYAGPGNAPGHPQLITAGTFTVGSDGSASVQMWSAADPRTFATMQITAEQPGDATQHGTVILSGRAQQ